MGPSAGWSDGRWAGRAGRYCRDDGDDRSEAAAVDRPAVGRAGSRSLRWSTSLATSHSGFWIAEKQRLKFYSITCGTSISRNTVPVPVPNVLGVISILI